MRALIISFLIQIAATICFADGSVEEIENPAIDYYSAENIRKFADFLMVEGDFSRAAGEYDRLLSLPSSGPVRDSAILWSGLAYLKVGDYVSSRRRFQLLIDSGPAGLKSRGVYHYACAAYSQGEYQGVTSLLREHSSDTGLARLGSIELLSVASARLRDWESARFFACSDASFDGNLDLCSLVVVGENLPTKSKTKAVLLSTIVPGLGKIYAKRRMDGLYAFFTVTTTAWQSYRGFDRSGKNSFQGWFFGALAGAFYLGNIYGTTVSVEIYNRQLWNRYYRDFEANIGLTMP